MTKSIEYCSCRKILDQLWVVYLSYKSVPEAKKEINPLDSELKAAEIIADIRDFLEQHRPEFNKCSCSTAEWLEEMLNLPVIQESDRSLLLPISFSRFWPLVRMLAWATQCKCKNIAKEVSLIWNKKTSKGDLVREIAPEIDAFFEAVVYHDIAWMIRDILENKYKAFFHCPCDTGKCLRMIWISPAIQETNYYQRRVPESLSAAKEYNRKFRQLEKIIQRKEG